MSLDTPVAFLIFKRPDTTQRVFQAIREAKPKKLLVVADGGRDSEEQEKCQQARAVIEKVDWDCEVLKNYSETNLGCKQRVSSGLDWVFSQVEEAIILEDDCVPNSSFFSFCAELLSLYRYDNRIMQIGGTNFFKSPLNENYQYFFSKHFTSWGWGTWSRAWQYYDKELNLFRFLYSENCLSEVWPNLNEREKRERQILNIINGNIDSWAYIWSFPCAVQKGFSVLPKYNLIKNIGFSDEATNTKSKDERSFYKTESLVITNHPNWIYFPDQVERERLSRFAPKRQLNFRQKMLNKVKNFTSKLQS